MAWAKATTLLTWRDEIEEVEEEMAADDSNGGLRPYA